ncbi:MAG: outer membrane beta-barrel protein [Porphyromonadaceae bacterium]|nr:outer membrane beta-barrel protein [Porphyromonadaceae bacterium]
MKKMIVTALVLAAGVLGVSAQSVTPRVEVGAAFSNMSFEKQSASTKTGLRAGAAVEVGLTAPGAVSVYLAPGVTYKMGGYKTTSQAVSNALGDLASAFGGFPGVEVIDAIKGLASGQVTTHNISVPVNFGMRAAFASAFAASVEVGPYFSYALAAKLGEQNLYDLNKDAKRFDAGLGISAAIEYNKFYLRLGTEFGFVNQFGKDQASDGKNKNFYTTLGFRF